MSASSVRGRGSIRSAAGAAAALVAVGLPTLAACGGSPAAQPTPSASSSLSPSSSPSSISPASPSAPSSPPVSSPSTQQPVKDQVRLDITITDGKVDPSGKKIDVPLGATVVLTVTSDEDDEVHAHVGDGDGYSLEAKAGQTVTGQFSLTSPGSFEVESHHLDKIIAILNVR